MARSKIKLSLFFVFDLIGLYFLFGGIVTHIFKIIIVFKIFFLYILSALPKTLSNLFLLLFCHSFGSHRRIDCSFQPLLLFAQLFRFAFTLNTVVFALFDSFRLGGQFNHDFLSLLLSGLLDCNPMRSLF